MRFTTEHAHAILQGSKREHRVRPRTKPYRVGDRLTIQRPKHVDEMTPLERVRYEEGDGHRGHKSIGHLLVTSTHLAQLGELTIVQARAEGYRDRAGFARAWMGFPAGDTSTDEDVLELFEAHHASVWVVVLGVEADLRDVPRWSGIRTFDHLEDGRRVPEPEWLSEADYDTHVEKRREMTHTQWRALEHTNREMEIALLSFEQRRLRAVRLAQARHVNASSGLRVVDRLIAQRAKHETIEEAFRRVEAMVEAA